MWPLSRILAKEWGNCVFQILGPADVVITTTIGIRGCSYCFIRRRRLNEDKVADWRG